MAKGKCGLGVPWGPRSGVHDSDSDLIAGLPACLSVWGARPTRPVDVRGFGGLQDFGTASVYGIIIYHESHLLKITNLRVPLLRIY